MLLLGAARLNMKGLCHSCNQRGSWWPEQTAPGRVQRAWLVNILVASGYQFWVPLFLKTPLEIPKKGLIFTRQELDTVKKQGLVRAG